MPTDEKNLTTTVNGDGSAAADVSYSPEEKKKELYRSQVELMKTLLSHNAITQEQFNKSYRDLTVKMGMTDEKSAG